MFYIGHFSFYGPEGAEGATSGFFNCVAEADSPEEAVDKFGELLDTLKENDDVFDGVDDVFLDQCTEIKSVPELGFLDYWIAVEPEPTNTITTSLRGVDPSRVTAFVMGSDEEGEEGEEESSEPFMCWGEGHEHE